MQFQPVLPPFPVGRDIVQQVAAAGGSFSTLAGNGTMKASIILFDIKPGTRTFTVPSGVRRIRAAVAGAGGAGANTGGGAGGGYSEKVFDVTPGQQFSYTVGTGGAVEGGNGGSSSFGAVITATGGGGGGGGAAGAGSGGDINTSGGGTTSGGGCAGGASGHRFGDGQGGINITLSETGGGGWSQPGFQGRGGAGLVDGWGLGFFPTFAGGDPGSTSLGAEGGYGAGGGGPGGASGAGAPGTMGGGGGGGGGGTTTGARGGLGGGGGGGGNVRGPGGNGVVIVEVLG